MRWTARIGGLLGAAAAFTTAMVNAGPPGWAAAGLTAGTFILLVLVLFLPSETPARRLGHLIQARRNPTGATAGPGPRPLSSAPSPTTRNGSI
ncbi:hypothetical protein ACIA78_39485 [Streptomyces xanthochromogenes]|uniref:hypothetical protein n=1 Tax=Streptomyces xanthochromogenes TaxID=67384 RepID=UPI00343DE541